MVNKSRRRLLLSRWEPADFGHNLAMAALSNIFNCCVKPYTDKPLVDLAVTVSIDGNLFGFGRISAVDNLS